MTDFADLRELVIWWLVCRVTRRQSDVWFSPWYNSLWLTGLKVPTNSHPLSIFLSLFFPPSISLSVPPPSLRLASSLSLPLSPSLLLSPPPLPAPSPFSLHPRVCFSGLQWLSLCLLNGWSHRVRIDKNERRGTIFCHIKHEVSPIRSLGLCRGHTHTRCLPLHVCLIKQQLHDGICGHCDRHFQSV